MQKYKVKKALDDLKENVKEKQAAGKEAVEDKVDQLKAKAADAKVQGEKTFGRFKGKCKKRNKLLVKRLLKKKQLI